MTQTPLQEEEAAGVTAASADLKEHDPTAGKLREKGGPKTGEDRSWHEPDDVEASRAAAGARPSLRDRIARAPLKTAGVAVGGALLAGGAALLIARAMTHGRPGGYPPAMGRKFRRH